jgi:hypothetical protein
MMAAAVSSGHFVHLIAYHGALLARGGQRFTPAISIGRD